MGHLGMNIKYWKSTLAKTCLFASLSSSLSVLRGNCQLPTHVSCCPRTKDQTPSMTVSWEPNTHKHINTSTLSKSVFVSNCHCLCLRGGEQRGPGWLHLTGSAEASVSADHWLQVQEEAMEEEDEQELIQQPSQSQDLINDLNLELIEVLKELTIGIFIDHPSFPFAVLSIYLTSTIISFFYKELQGIFRHDESYCWIFMTRHTFTGFSLYKWVCFDNSNVLCQVSLLHQHLFHRLFFHSSDSTLGPMWNQ